MEFEYAGKKYLASGYRNDNNEYLLRVDTIEAASCQIFFVQDADVQTGGTNGYIVSAYPVAKKGLISLMFFITFKMRFKCMAPCAVSYMVPFAKQSSALLSYSAIAYKRTGSQSTKIYGSTTSQVKFRVKQSY